MGTTEEEGDGLIATIKQRAKDFYASLTATKYTDDDFYAYSFGVDLICFVYTIFIWAEFRKDDGSSTNFLSFLFANRIPIVFILVLLTQFLLIIANRFIYLNSSIHAKLVYHGVVTLGFHIFLFIYVPQATAKPFNASPALEFFYFLRVVSMGLSALQIRYGYPIRTSGQALTKRASPLRGKLFGAYRAIPFVYELRILMDWISTPTTLEFYEWLKVEDISSSVFAVKCGLMAQEAAGRKRGESQPPKVKLGTGAVLFTFLIFLLWVPLFIFSSANPAVSANPVETIDVSLRLDDYAPLYTATLSIYGDDLAVAQRVLPLGPRGSNFSTLVFSFPGVIDAGDYRKDTVQVSSWPLLSQGPRSWSLPTTLPPRDQVFTTLFAHITYTRLKDSEAQVIETHRWTPVSANASARLVAGERVVFDTFIPTFISLGATSNPLDIPAHDPIPLAIQLNSNGTWVVTQDLRPGVWDGIRDTGDRVMHFVVSPEIPDEVLAALGGILGIYIGVVLAVGRMLRSYVNGVSHRIMFEDLIPNPDPILQVCKDISIVRQEGDLALEEDLYSELIELYRSPEALITRTQAAAVVTLPVEDEPGNEHLKVE